MQALPSRGAMLALRVSEPEAIEYLRTRAISADAGELAIAAVNGPASTVLSGDEGAVLSAAEYFQSLGRVGTRLRVSHAFHSPHMEPMLDAFRRVASTLRYEKPSVPIVSNVTGKLVVADELCCADYWVRQVRSAVRFLDGVRAVQAYGVASGLELGPHGVLSLLCGDALAAEQSAPAFVPVLRKGRAELQALAECLSTLHVRGHAIDWEAYFAPFGPRRVTLPTYAFQSESFRVGALGRTAPRSCQARHWLNWRSLRAAKSGSTASKSWSWRQASFCRRRRHFFCR